MDSRRWRGDIELSAASEIITEELGGRTFRRSKSPS